MIPVLIWVWSAEWKIPNFVRLRYKLNFYVEEWEKQVAIQKCIVCFIITHLFEYDVSIVRQRDFTAPPPPKKKKKTVGLKGEVQ